MMKKKGFIMVSAIVGIVLIIWGLAFIWPVKPRPKHAFFKEDDQTLVIAHRGGRAHAPENTLPAFARSVELGVDVLELDVHLTKDEEIVVLHDATVDRTTDGSGHINELTYAEVEVLDAGYYYQDEAGDYTYRDQGVHIPRLEEVFDQFPAQRYFIELKDTTAPVLQPMLIQKVWELIQQYQMEDQVVIGSFDHDLIEDFQQISGGQVAIGAGEQAARSFVKGHLAYLNGWTTINADSLQLPLEKEGHDLTHNNLLRGVLKQNIALYYWTINDPATMHSLLDKEVDGIMTDHPALLLEIIAERQK